jgi:predicted transcriptional regulator of viral defense system
VKAGKLASPHHEFFVVVPLEYRDAGVPPAFWFLDALMVLVDRPYYAGLLTAAELYGAAHQRPQQIQVMTTRPMRPATVGRNKQIHITWTVGEHVGHVPTAVINVPTGTLRVSTPEVTAFDLVRYARRAGGLDHVATTLAELGERLDAKALAHVARILGDVTGAQRVGYILDILGHTSATVELAAWLMDRNPRLRPVVLWRNDPVASHHQRVSPWNVIVNRTLDPDI